MLAYQSILAWVVIGALAGWIAGLLVEGYGFGLFGNVVIGILGAAIAGALVQLFGIHTHGTLGNLVASIVGALSLLGLIGLARRL